MKANEAPEKLYILNHIDYSDRRILNAFTEKENNNDIEYTRTDAFIKKAAEWFRRIDYDDTISPYETTEEFIEAFKEAMTL